MFVKIFHKRFRGKHFSTMQGLSMECLMNLYTRTKDTLRKQECIWIMIRIDKMLGRNYGVTRIATTTKYYTCTWNTWNWKAPVRHRHSPFLVASTAPELNLISWRLHVLLNYNNRNDIYLNFEVKISSQSSKQAKHPRLNIEGSSVNARARALRFIASPHARGRYLAL